MKKIYKEISHICTHAHTHKWHTYTHVQKCKILHIYAQKYVTYTYKRKETHRQKNTHLKKYVIDKYAYTRIHRHTIIFFTHTHVIFISHKNMLYTHEYTKMSNTRTKKKKIPTSILLLLCEYHPLEISRTISFPL